MLDAVTFAVSEKASGTVLAPTASFEKPEEVEAAFWNAGTR